jgi:hypothetical protein
MARNKKGY